MTQEQERFLNHFGVTEKRNQEIMDMLTELPEIGYNAARDKLHYAITHTDLHNEREKQMVATCLFFSMHIN